MDIDRVQAQCLHAWQLQSPAVLSIGLREVRKHPQLDLCGLLLQHDRITPAWAVRVRAEAERLVRSQSATLAGANPGVVERLRRDQQYLETLRVARPESSDLAAPRVVGVLPVQPAVKRRDPRQGTGSSRLSTVRYEREEPRSGCTSILGLGIPGYEFLGEIGCGAHGVVLKARHAGSGGLVALKLLLESSVNPALTRRFRREARALAKLDHPAVVSAVEYGFVDDDPFLAMEFLDGENLQDFVEKCRLDTGKPPGLTALCAIAAGVADALDHCHERGIVHRDVKPHNIVLNSDSGAPVLVDFGLTKGKLYADGTHEFTTISETGEILGTPAYMAPEQLDARGGFGEIGPGVDVYGLAASLAYLCTGQAPYVEASLMALIVALGTKSPRRPRELDSDLPEWFDSLIVDCYARDPAERPTAKELARRLRAGGS
jgi:serine/threonine protein kinase